MSRLANNPIQVAKTVSVAIQTGVSVTVKADKFNDVLSIPEGIDVVQEGDKIFVKANDKIKEKAMLGTFYANLRNAVVDVQTGAKVKLQLVGVGYKVEIIGDLLKLNLALSHSIYLRIPKSIKIEVTGNDVIVTAPTRAVAGQVASFIRSYRKPEPYKGKGIRIEGERIILKEVKKK